MQSERDRRQADAVTEDQLVLRARQIKLCRKKRGERFEPDMFGEAAWDALLALYLDEKAGLTVTVARLAQMLDRHIPSLSRWLDYLKGLGLITLAARWDGPTGVVRLSDKGRSDLELYLRETLTIIP